jgi:hypothetical protein
MVLSLLGTFFAYLISILFFKSILDVTFILNDFVWLEIIVITLISWFPFYFIRRLQSCICPSQVEIIRRYKSGKEDGDKDIKPIELLN